MNQEKIGLFIAKCRREKNMTQEDLAEKLGVSNKSISRWENGKTMMDISLFEPLCNELDISIIELLTNSLYHEMKMVKYNEWEYFDNDADCLKCESDD